MIISMKMLGYYGNEYRMIKDEYSIELSTEYIESMKIMQKVVNEWSIITNNNVVGTTSNGMESIYWNKYDNVINNEYWIDMLDQLGNYNDKLTWNREDFNIKVST